MTTPKLVTWGVVGSVLKACGVEDISDDNSSDKCGQPLHLGKRCFVAYRPVVSVDLVQEKSRWLPEEEGYCASGFRTRQRLRSVLRCWQSIRWGMGFITLTYDPWRWVKLEKPGWWDESDFQDPRRAEVYASAEWQEGARSCYLASRRQRHTGEFFRRLRAELGVSDEGRVHAWRVIEFHKSGFIHYHIIINRSFILYSRLQEKWGWGHVLIKPADLSTAGYLTKYLTKGVTAPRWLVDGGFSSSIRLTYPTRGFWGQPEEVAAVGRSATTAARRPSPSIAEVLARPRGHLRTMMRIVLGTGEEVYRSAPSDISQSVDLMFKLGAVGGYVTKDVKGSASMVFPAGSAVSLDLLVNCGRGLPCVVDSS